MLQPIVDHIQEEAPGLSLNVWYLDDGTLIGLPTDLTTALYAHPWPLTDYPYILVVDSLGSGVMYWDAQSPSQSNPSTSTTIYNTVSHIVMTV